MKTNKKQALLQEKANVFKQLLIENQEKNINARKLLKFLSSLFHEIETGKIIPPKHYEYGSVLGKDNPFYEPDSPFDAAETEFIAALEDWESKSWYNPPLKK